MKMENNELIISFLEDITKMMLQNEKFLNNKTLNNNSISFLELSILLITILIPIIGEAIFKTQFYWFIGLFPSLILAYHFGLRGGLLYATVTIISKGTFDLVQWFNGDVTKEEMSIIFSNLFAILIISFGIGYLTDIMRRKNTELENAYQKLSKANTKLMDMTVKDSLTGLFNHRFFQQVLDNKIREAIKKDLAFSLIMGDIDFFRKYNETHGHLAGDKILKVIAEVLQEVANNKGDVVARYGGEEFILLLWDTERKTAIEVAEKIRLNIEQYPFFGKETQPNGKLTMSLGIASYPEDADNKEGLMQVLDSALMQAKTASKNKVGVYYSIMYALANSLNQTEQEIIDSIKTLVTIINAKDRYTFKHSERVVKYSVKLGQTLELSQEIINLLEVGAFLHDIGKIEIPEEILKKPGALNDEEWNYMKKHPVLGADLITSIKALQGCREIILYHHERYDGSGYPEGVKGKNIPLLARVVMIADSFDAMTTDRPYKRGKTLEEAIIELERCAGTHFDPDLVPIFKEILLKENHNNEVLDLTKDVINEESKVI